MSTASDPFYGTPTPITDENPRCFKCNKMLALRVTRPWRIRCPRCKSSNGHT